MEGGKKKESNIELVDIKGQSLLIPLCLKGSLHRKRVLGIRQ